MGVCVDVGAGEWLIEHRGEIDRGEAHWLERLAEFDRAQLWELDGQLGCVAWLVWRTNMSRTTAFEKLRVAHELERRPIVAEAFAGGRISYSAVRALTRLERPDPEVDVALVALAEGGQASILDLEQAVRAYRLYADQERPPQQEGPSGRDVRIVRGQGGTGRVVITLADLELEEFAATLQAFLDLRYRPGGTKSSPTAPTLAELPLAAPTLAAPTLAAPTSADQPVDEYSREYSAAEEAPSEADNRCERKAEAFMDLVRTALAHADEGRASGDDRYLVHLVSHPGDRSLRLVNGAPLNAVEAGAVACDASRVAQIVSDGGEPLYLGRRTRDWNTAQRRAITVRDGGRCRFVGCDFTHYDIHHLHTWEAGGSTDIDNGLAVCPRHHHKLHAGYQVTGDPNGELRFHRPNGSYLGSTRPATKASSVVVVRDSRRSGNLVQFGR